MPKQGAAGGHSTLMVLAVPSWRSWCCSLPVCLHGVCRGAIPARERQREHGRGSTSTAPGHWGRHRAGGHAWGPLLGHTALGCSWDGWGAQRSGAQPGGHSSEATAGGLTGAGVAEAPSGPYRAGEQSRAVLVQGAAGGTLTGWNWAGVAHRAALRERWPDAGEGSRAGPRGSAENQRFWAR